jgi:pyrroline-5-carboxylate reductase
MIRGHQVIPDTLMTRPDRPPARLPSDFPVTFLGGGNMAAALIAGLLRGGHVPGAITVIEIDPARGAALTRDFGVAVTDAPPSRLSHQLVVLAVKPQQMHAALRNLRLAPDCVVVSIAAGLSVAQLGGDLPATCPIIRCMPNSPALVGAGMTVLYADGATAAAARALAEGLMGATGACAWVDDEAQLDAVTAVSGSGPAYFLRLAECLADAGRQLGLPAALADQLARQTLVGSGALVAQQPDTTLATLRANVTSKGGTTEAALQAFDQQGLAALVQQAVTAAAERSMALRQTATGDARGAAAGS